jgi:hypothetical protein
MKLPQMYTNYLDLTEEGREEFILIYSTLRQEDLSKLTAIMKKTSSGVKSSSKKEKSISVTDEQMQLLKQLGLI